MKKFTLFILLGLFSSNSLYAHVQINCPQIKAIVNYGQSINDDSGRAWKVWAQANTLAVNTWEDPYYTSTVRQDPYSNSWELSCVGGWKPNGNYTLYAFKLLVNYKKCTELPKSSFICD